MKKIFIMPVMALLIFIAACSSEKRLIRKASNAVEVYDYDKAIGYYNQALAKDSNSFYANAGKGIVLAEYMGRYDQAIPYLERALRKSPAETKGKINSDLGKSYHYVGNYPRALYFYDATIKYNRDDKSPDYDAMLSKRIADCHYAMEHQAVASAELQSVKNIGPVINSDMPEYSPVYTNGEMIFSSKRKDTPDEKKNGIDRRYFESMYITSYTDGVFSMPRRYTLPDYGGESHYRKGGESVVSATSDGNTVFIFREGKIYEASLKDSTKGEHKLPSNINFSYLQCHAFLSKDGKMLLFTSEADNGRGGTDIYKSTRNEDGKWSDPQILPVSINTYYNEDAPFLTDDGTLFFSSNGHPGYGGYDIYKTRFVNGEWTTPQNLGQPVNTPADDIYFALKPNSADGYYSSNRVGGYGDMDIYSVHYVSPEIPDCSGTDSLFAIDGVPSENNQYTYDFVLSVPEQYRNNVRTISWTVNAEPLAATTYDMQHTFAGAGTYTIFTKVVSYCDTCPGLFTRCVQREVTIGTPVLANNETIRCIRPEQSANERANELSIDQLNAIGWNMTPAYFDYDSYVLKGEAREMLDQNIKALKNNPELTLVVNGYSDARGTAEYNQDLSSKRINSVRQYLQSNGISKRRVTTVRAFGETMILNGCTDDVVCDEGQHQENRKVDFKVINSNRLITSVSLLR